MSYEYVNKDKKKSIQRKATSYSVRDNKEAGRFSSLIGNGSACRLMGAASKTNNMETSNVMKPDLSLNDVRLHYSLDKQHKPQANSSMKDISMDDETLERESYRLDEHKDTVIPKKVSPVIQGKFVGSYGELLTTLPVQDGTCKALISYLSGNEKEILVEHTGGQSCFEPATSTLRFNGDLFTQFCIAWHDKEYETVSVITANICHELSHVNDYITKKETGTDPETVISTELRAWTREAISIMEINKINGLQYNASYTELVNGWFELNPNMLDNLDGNQGNVIIDRLFRYIKNCTKLENPQLWLNGFNSSNTLAEPRKNRYKEQIIKLKESITGKKTELGYE